MTEAELINQVKAELTNSCSLPYALRDAEILRLIQKTAKWFYDNYGDAVEERYILLPINIYENAHFITNRVIQMPDCVQFVYELRETRGGGMLGNIDPDFSDSKMLGSELYLSPFSGDNMVYRTAMYAFFDLAKAYDLETIAFKWNKNTKRISVLGRTPRKNTFVKAAIQIPLESLYEDELFVRFILAEAKINLGRVLGVFTYNLPGGVQINFDGIKQDGKDELLEIKTQIDGENAPGWFLQWN